MTDASHTRRLFVADDAAVRCRRPRPGRRRRPCGRCRPRARSRSPSPVSQASIASSVSSSSIGVVERQHPVADRRDRRMAHDVDHAAHAVAQPHAVAVVRQHAELDDGIDRADRRTAAAPRPCENTRMTAPISRPPASAVVGRADARRTRSSACRSARRRRGPERVAQHRAEHRRVAASASARRASARSRSPRVAA